MSTSVQAFIPSPPQGVWYLGFVPIRAYALCIIVGVIAGMALTMHRYSARGGSKETVYDAALVIVPCGIIGGRLYHVITDHQLYFCDTCNPIDALKITNGGLGIWGAVVLGTLGIYVLFRMKKLPMSPFADAVAPGIILGQAIGRLGNYFNQELYGGPTTLPWGLEIFNRVNDAGKFAPLTGRSTGEVLTVVHPTFLYELIWNLAVCLFLIWADRRFRMHHGQVFAAYVACYTLGRFFIELMRTDPANHIVGLRINAVVALVTFGLALFVYRRLRTQYGARAREGSAGTGHVATAGSAHGEVHDTPARLAGSS